MAKHAAADIPEKSGSRYPAPFNEPCMPRAWRALGDAFGLTQFGVNLVRLPPGAWSSQRHWHSHEDEFVYMLEGEAVLVTDAGETVLNPGEFAGFKAGVKDGHCVKNLSDRDAVMLVIGSRHDEDHGEYPDIDMKFGRGHNYAPSFTRKDGTPY